MNAGCERAARITERSRGLVGGPGHWRHRALVALLCVAAAPVMLGCQTGATLVRDPQASYHVAGLTVAPPSAGGWFLVEEKADRVLLSQPLERNGSARTVWARSLANSRAVGGYAHLHSIALRLTRQLDRKRFVAQSIEVQPYNVANAVCVRRAMRLHDRQAPPESGITHFEMQSIDILCRHPIDAKTMTWIHASVRDLPGKVGDEGAKLADTFYGKVRFEPTSVAQ